LDEANSAEREEIKNIRREKDEADARNMAAFEQMMRDGLEIKRQRELTATQNQDPNSNLQTEIAEGVKSNINPFSGESIVPLPENPELRAIREERERIICNQENVNVNHIMPPAPPVDVVEDDEGSSSKLTLADNTIKPPDPPVPVVAPASWNKLQIESEGDEEEDLGEVGENTAQKNNIEFSMTGATDLDGLD